MSKDVHNVLRSMLMVSIADIWKALAVKHKQQLA